MSTNLCFNIEKTQKRADFRQSDDSCYLRDSGTKLKLENGYYIVHWQDNLPVPTQLVDLIEQVTCREIFHKEDKVTGSFILRSANAQCRLMSGDASEVNIISSNTQDAWDLLGQIILGTATPSNALSYDDLKERVTKLQDQVADLRDQNQDLAHRQLELVGIRDATLSLFNGIDRYGFFFFLKAPRDILSSLREKIAASVRHD